MKIQLNTDVHIDGTEALAAQVGATASRRWGASANMSPGWRFI
jgi:hypothetical protein